MRTNDLCIILCGKHVYPLKNAPRFASGRENICALACKHGPVGIQRDFLHARPVVVRYPNTQVSSLPPCRVEYFFERELGKQQTSFSPIRRYAVDAVQRKIDSLVKNVRLLLFG